MELMTWVCQSLITWTPTREAPPPLCSDAGLKRFLGENAGLKENKRFWGENAGLKVPEQLIRGTLFVDISKEIV